MYCPKCGQYSDGNERFCAACGSPLTVANNSNEVKASMRTSLMVCGIACGLFSRCRHYHFDNRTG